LFDAAATGVIRHVRLTRDEKSFAFRIGKSSTEIWGGAAAPPYRIAGDNITGLKYLRPAECNSAIQQIANLRYGGSGRIWIAIFNFYG
jgi:hypothetical protein